MIHIFIMAAFWGGLMNRFRGGLMLCEATTPKMIWRAFHRHIGENVIIPKNRDWVNAVVFGLMVLMVTHHSFTAIYAVLGMLAGSSYGWGRYIGAIGGWEQGPLEEDELVDLFIGWLKPNSHEGIDEAGNLVTIYSSQNKLFWWGMVGLSLRGVHWAWFLIPIAGWWVLLVGAQMGVAYYLMLKLARNLNRTNWKGDGWEWGEICYGALLWGTVLLLTIGGLHHA